MQRSNDEIEAADVITLLEQDHADVRALFREFSEASREEKGDIATQICEMLTAHAMCEEEIVYPAAREVLDEPDLVNEAEIEHATAKDLIAKIEAMDPSDEKFDAMVTVLGEYIDHHVREEEQEMFPLLEKSELDLVALGDEVAARKTELTDDAEAIAS